MILAYTCHTSYPNLAALRKRGWRLMLSARGGLRPCGFDYALDNGAWTSFQKGEPFDAVAFEKAVEKLGAGADFIVVPDIVAGGMASLGLSIEWLPRLRGIARLLIPVQDGMNEEAVIPHLGSDVGIFIGGSTPWKLATAGLWGAVAKQCGCWLHAGRVNSAKRVYFMAAAGAHSFDGTGPARFLRTLPTIDNARRQMHLNLLDMLATNTSESHISNT